MNNLTTIPASTGETLSNTEWQLADMVDAIAAEIDHAEDTLALKSYARGMSFSIRQLSLDLQVSVRRDNQGQVKFRTADPNSTGTTTIKLDFAQLLKSQLGDDRRKLEQTIDRRPLDAIGFTVDEIRALNAIAIYSVDDLHRYTQTAAMIGEVCRKTSIAEAHLRKVLGLPYLEALKPDRGLPGSIVLLEGGNFGIEQPHSASVYFQGVVVPIVAWSNSRIQIKIPEKATGNGVIFIATNDQMTNPIDWQVVTVDLMIKDIVMTPSNPQDNDEITLTATLENQGLGTANAFAVQWSIDGNPQPKLPHGVLAPNQTSQESTVVLKTRLAAGKHEISFMADPEQQLQDLDRANSTFTLAIDVAPKTEIINLGYHYLIDSLDPFVGEQSWDFRQDVLSLIYRGLMRFDPYKGRLLTDLSQSTNWSESLTVTYSLRPNVYFHDRSSLTADDVVFSYQRAKESPIWREQLRFIESIEAIDRLTVMFKLSKEFNIKAEAQIWTLPIVPAKAYQTDSQRFMTQPIGCGPFIGTLDEGQRKSGLVKLEAFENYYLGAPRTRSLSIALSPDANRLLKLLIGGYVTAITLPYQEGLVEKLKASLPTDNYQMIQTPIGQSMVLHVQARSLLERQPNDYETNWNAHLWYL